MANLASNAKAQSLRSQKTVTGKVVKINMITERSFLFAVKPEGENAEEVQILCQNMTLGTVGNYKNKNIKITFDNDKTMLGIKVINPLQGISTEPPEIK